jgi:hydroxymethylpyrimidine kinase/phosphomethylpyrimidine kinase/thiamine-phosphate diphosphorylase
VLGDPALAHADAPALARRLREAGAAGVCIVGVTGLHQRPLHWLDSEHAKGWLEPAAGPAASGERFAQALRVALDQGFVPADAAVLATMATSRSDAATEGDFATDARLLPRLSWSEEPRFAEPEKSPRRRLDLYAIVDSTERLAQVVAAGVRTVQLRIKTPQAPDDRWHAMLRREVQRSIQVCSGSGVELFINDHWQLAAELGAHGAHLGQEDLLALGDAGRSTLQVTGLALGVSSHSLWELCRARALAPRYIACGPVWPTLTKAMPWRAQGMDNLSWWCRMAGAPVVAIGGLLGPDQVRDAARCGADGVCIVRGLGEQPVRVLPALQAALEAGRAAGAAVTMSRPHPSLQWRANTTPGF